MTFSLLDCYRCKKYFKVLHSDYKSDLDYRYCPQCISAPPPRGMSLKEQTAKWGNPLHLITEKEWYGDISAADKEEQREVAKNKEIG